MFQDRIERAQAALVDYGIDGFIVERSEDLAYFLGDKVTSGTLLIGKNEVVFLSIVWIKISMLTFKVLLLYFVIETSENFSFLTLRQQHIKF